MMRTYNSVHTILIEYTAYAKNKIKTDCYALTVCEFVCAVAEREWSSAR